MEKTHKHNLRLTLMEQKFDSYNEQNSVDHRRIEKKIDELAVEVKSGIKNKASRSEVKEFKDDFIYWRNILVGGILLSIFLMVLGIYFNNIL